MERFAKEKEMLPALLDWIRPQFTTVETELYCGYAGDYVPDVVGIKFDLKLGTARKRKTPRSRREITKLIRENRLPEKIHSDMIAVELKLNNFVEAFFQAKMYQWFGFRAFIAMPKGSLLKVKPIRYKALEYDGIGFIEIGDKCEIMLPAGRPLHFSEAEETQIAERLICRGMVEHILEKTR